MSTHAKLWPCKDAHGSTSPSLLVFCHVFYGCTHYGHVWDNTEVGFSNFALLGLWKTSDIRYTAEALAGRKITVFFYLHQMTKMLNIIEVPSLSLWDFIGGREESRLGQNWTAFELLSLASVVSTNWCLSLGALFSVDFFFFLWKWTLLACYWWNMEFKLHKSFGFVWFVVYEIYVSNFLLFRHLCFFCLSIFFINYFWILILALPFSFFSLY